MLVEFSVGNYRSIQEKQTLSMVAADNETMLDSNTFPVPNNDDLRLVTSAAIYGPNASGKSNLLKAMQVLKNLVIKSASRMQIGDKLPVEPFRLNSESAKKPSSFEVIFIHEKIRYEYGVSLNRERVFEEWLIAYRNEVQENWFSREYLPDNPTFEPNEGYKWSFGKGLKGEKKRIQRFVRSNSLFISHAAQNNHPQLTEVFDFFQDELKIILHIDTPFIVDDTNNEGYYNYMVKLLNEADIGIADLKIEIIPETLNDDMIHRIQQEMQKLGINAISKDIPDFGRLDIITVHKMNDSDKTVEFEIDEESDGTKRLFEIAGYWLYVLQNGEILIIDEIDRSLHPVLSKALIKMFNNPEINKNNAQLIFTTHDTTLLDGEIFRPDQIWFTEKDNSMTKLYSLFDFRPREDESLQKGYLLGRYGAIPFINGLSI
ncbi:AAA family ATPase [Dolichospermum flos-aquae]|uniref:ATP-binding protein n=1 Tax=Dolichospermum flos-aquae CCAP 1403/13F TaxID=315271 RepID=A0A6H2C2G3_DOLFA|nr:ATP-binding protein [Dolichospermum flos-aquae]QJB45490.1 ATP-binding protein [Dolichospermum flos-aquae CCAP 1403/13F]